MHKSFVNNLIPYENVFVFKKEALIKLTNTIHKSRRWFYFLNGIILTSTFIASVFTALIFALYEERPIWYYYVPVAISAITSFIASWVNFTSIKKTLMDARLKRQRIESETLRFNIGHKKKYRDKDREFNFFVTLLVILDSKAARRAK